jgi:AraC-like DNA-binding protein
MDAFSDILSGLKLDSAIFFTAEFSAPWAVAVPGAPDLVLFHLVADGHAVVEAGGEHIELNPGDVVVLPNGGDHQMGSREVARPGLPRPQFDYSLVTAKIAARDLTPLRVGGGGECARVVCGYLACDPHLSRPLFAALPPAFKVHIRSGRGGPWLESSILHLVEEAGSGRAGCDALLAKLSETMVIETLRRFADALPATQMGWLAAARDPMVGKSLSLIHGRVAYPWTIATLAAEAGLSRSALAERFTRYLGEPPMAYLTRWRLQLAARALASTTRGIADIASGVGYESEAAFNRAFKRAFGLPPGQYRAQRQHSGA